MAADRTLITTGTVGAIIAAICCFTPVLAILLSALGLAAWLGVADYVLVPALLICLGLIGVGLYLRRTAERACRVPAGPDKVQSHE